MITERTLRQWRMWALKELKSLEGLNDPTQGIVERKSMAHQIERMTQELLDQHLLQKEK